MIGILIVTHGRLSETLAETAQLIMGPQTDMTAICFSARDSLETLRERTRTAVAPYLETGCLILTDIIGGSATNICTDLLGSDKIRVLTGVSLPMVLEGLGNRSRLNIDELAHKVKDGGVRGIIDVKEFLSKRAKSPVVSPKT
jgi:mannose PTS system EIIA component